jgi:dethiobiotin synthetase
MTQYFITGTDTGIGKTYITTGLLKLFEDRGLSTLGLKPVASGCDLIDGALQNEDALLLQQTSSLQVDYDTINPFAFEEPIAPHLAARKAGTRLNVETLSQTLLNTWIQHPSDITLIEGAGGWLVPLNETETLADLVIALNLPVILVVGMRLGCINHALLTYEVMKQQKINLKGWMANCIDPSMQALDENIETLKQKIEVPCLGVIPWRARVETNIELLL